MIVFFHDGRNKVVGLGIEFWNIIFLGLFAFVFGPFPESVLQELLGFLGLIGVFVEQVSNNIFVSLDHLQLVLLSLAHLPLPIPLDPLDKQLHLVFLLLLDYQLLLCQFGVHGLGNLVLKFLLFQLNLVLDLLSFVVLLQALKQLLPLPQLNNGSGPLFGVHELFCKLRHGGVSLHLLFDLELINQRKSNVLVLFHVFVPRNFEFNYLVSLHLLD